MKFRKQCWVFACALAAVLTLGLIGCQTEDAETTAESVTESDTTVTATDTEPSESASGATVTEAPTESATTEPEEMTMAPTESLTVIADGKTDYSVLADAGVTEACRAELDWLYAVMDEKYGTHPAENGNDSGKILSLRLEGNSHDWSVSVDKTTGSITLTGGSAAALGQAIRYVGTQFCGSANGSLTVPADGSYTYSYETDQIHNAGYLKYEGRGTASPSDEKGELMTPTWLDTAIMVEVRLDIASIGGTFQDSYDLIDFYADAGVNVIWLCPIYQRGPGGNGYGNVGPHTVEPALTGTQDMAEGWKVVKEFVDYAHSKGVYILLDIVSWGTMKGAPLVS